MIFNDLFGGVVYAGLDTDKHKYPIGSGRVTFNNAKSYMKVRELISVFLMFVSFILNLKLLCNS